MIDFFVAAAEFIIPLIESTRFPFLLPSKPIHSIDRISNSYMKK